MYSKCVHSNPTSKCHKNLTYDETMAATKSYEKGKRPRKFGLYTQYRI